jgi:hypothetical protein
MQSVKRPRHAPLVDVMVLLCVMVGITIPVRLHAAAHPRTAADLHGQQGALRQGGGTQAQLRSPQPVATRR